jgi:transposase InsO family protein
MKRGLPRALMTDNGAAMLAEETAAGLDRLGVLHQTTLPYSPYQYVALKNMWPPASFPRRREAGSRVNAT